MHELCYIHVFFIHYTVISSVSEPISQHISNFLWKHFNLCCVKFYVLFQEHLELVLWF